MKIFKKSMLAVLCMVLCFSFISCNKAEEKVSLWENATYTDNQVFGDGSKTIILEVKAEEKSVEFTFRTEAEILADVLTEHNIISGEEGPYGIYVTSVNGIEAIYEENQSFWSLERNGLQLTTGVSETGIKDGDKFTFVYTIV
ncbi:MAG: DUF4430 domain-containing protein [Clostridia bacterium]|nr:DUF4430 domain-containing protein [Clostridia bacterium]